MSLDAMAAMKRWILGVVLLATGWTNRLRDISMRTARDHYWLQLFVYVLLLSAISKLLGLALDIYDFRLEHSFHLSNQKIGSWILDEMKSWVVGLVIGAILAEIVYGLMRMWPANWWIFAWMIIVVMLIFFTQIAPVVSVEWA